MVVLVGEGGGIRKFFLFLICFGRGMRGITSILGGWVCGGY
jgi:hypothetical protein